MRRLIFAWLVVWSTMAFGQNYSILTTHVSIKTIDFQTQKNELSKRVLAGIKWDFRLDNENNTAIIKALTHDGNEFTFTINRWSKENNNLWLYGIEDSTGDEITIMLAKNDGKNSVFTTILGSNAIIIYDDI